MPRPRGCTQPPLAEGRPLVRSSTVEAGALRGTPRGSMRASALILIGTCTRIVATPVVMALLLTHSYTAAAILFLVVSATDWFDGRLARRWNVSSKLGSFLDTTADKLLVTGTLVALVAVDRASPWVALVMIGREMTVLGLRAAVAASGQHLEASMLGQVEGDPAVRRAGAGDAAPGRDHRRRVPRPVGAGDRGAWSPPGPGSTTSCASRPRCAAIREPRLCHGWQRHRRPRGRGAPGRARRRGDRAGPILESAGVLRVARRRASCSAS